VAEHADSIAAHRRQRAQGGHRERGVCEHFVCEQVAAEKPVGEFVVVLKPIRLVGLEPSSLAAAIFETDRIRRERDDAAGCQSRPKGLHWVTPNAGRLALSEVVFAVVLMMDEHGREGSIAVGEQQIRGDRITVAAGVGDERARVAGLVVGFQRLKGGRAWDREP